MWTIYGVDSPNVEGVTNPKTIIIGDFKPSDAITEADFNNVSNTFLCQDGGSLVLSANKYSAYVQSSSYPSNLLGYTRFNILHRTTVLDGQIQYDYDDCYYTWAFETAGTNLYYFKGSNKGNIQYSVCPSVDFRIYQNAAITRNYVRTMQLIATEGSSDSGIGVVRPLWVFDFTNAPGWTSDHPVQAVLGPALPSPLIDEWLKNSKKNNPDAPVKPIADPEDADKSSAESEDFTWHNKFKIMNWSLSEWPQKFLIDGPPDNATDFLNNYCVFNPNNDPDTARYIPNRYTGDSTAVAAFWNQLKSIQEYINTYNAEAGHDVIICIKPVQNSPEGYFTTHNENIDNYPIFMYQSIAIALPSPKVVNLENNMFLDYSAYTGSYTTINKVKIGFGSEYFSVADCYANNTTLFSSNMPNTGSSTPSAFLDCCIIRHDGHYYLGGWYKYGSGYSAGGLCIICRIDNLDQMPDYGGSDPGDPTSKGIDKKDLDNTFGDGTKTAENPSTESVIDEFLGADGTGEKETEPTNDYEDNNTHDGSMGNGTGDPHADDEELPNPANDLPSGLDAEGTVSGSGVLSVFTPTLAELNTFTSELLSSTVLQSIKNYFTTNPMDGIFGLHILPYTGFAGTATANPRIGTHNFAAALTLATTEYLNVDYGDIYIPFVYNGFENYAPYSDAKIFLPFLGTKDIDINSIQGSRCHLYYNISLVTGDIYAYMYCQWAGESNAPGVGKGENHLLYSWQGNCAATVPLSHLDSTNYISGAMQVAGGITSLAAGAAMANPMAMVSGATAVSNGISETGRTSIVTSGNISGMAAFMGNKTPYMIISRPVMAFNAAYNHYLGLRSNAIMRIGDLRMGTYTEMRNVDLDGVQATGDELTELMSILKGGFYI